MPPGWLSILELELANYKAPKWGIMGIKQPTEAWTLRPHPSTLALKVAVTRATQHASSIAASSLALSTEHNKCFTEHYRPYTYIFAMFFHGPHGCCAQSYLLLGNVCNAFQNTVLVWFAQVEVRFCSAEKYTPIKIGTSNFHWLRHNLRNHEHPSLTEKDTVS